MFPFDQMQPFEPPKSKRFGPSRQRGSKTASQKSPIAVPPMPGAAQAPGFVSPSQRNMQGQALEAMAAMANQNMTNMANMAALASSGGLFGLNAMNALGAFGVNTLTGLNPLGALGAMSALGNMNFLPSMTSMSASLEVSEVIAGIESLYKDELKPYGRILRKRLAERAAAAGLGGVDVDIKRLRQVCELIPWLQIRSEEGGDWSATVRGRPAHFVDVYSPKDLYSDQLWAAAADYFDTLDDASMVLPGGRYSCAQALTYRNVSFLAGLSLGQVCHVVQLAISQKKLLGYLNGAVVPYVRSQSMVKERCAERGKPCSSAGRGGSLATWELVRSCLTEILHGLQPGMTSIPLSNVKRLFRSRYHVELSETALGHSKLSELLQDVRLGDICSVRLQGHGYVVIPKSCFAGRSWKSRDSLVRDATARVIMPAEHPQPEKAAETWLAVGSVFPTSVTAEAQPVVTGSFSLQRRAHFVQPLCMEDVAQGPQVPDWLPQLSPSVTRSRSVPVPKWEDGADGTSCSTGTGDTEERGSQNLETPPTRRMLTPSTLSTMGYAVHNTFIHAAMPPPTPPAGAMRSHSLPRNMGSYRSPTPCGQSAGRCFRAAQAT